MQQTVLFGIGEDYTIIAIKMFEAIYTDVPFVQYVNSTNPDLSVSQ